MRYLIFIDIYNMRFKIWLEAIGKNFEYQVPKSKMQQLYDFYMLAFLKGRSSYDSSIAKAYNSGIGVIRPPSVNFRDMDEEDKINYALQEVTDKLLPYLRSNFLNLVYYAICSEMFFILSLNNPIDLLQIDNSIEFRNFLKSLILYVRNPKLKDDSKELNLDLDRLNRNVGVKEFQFAIKAARKAYSSKSDFVHLASKMFVQAKWKNNFGGETWGNICKAWFQLLNSKSEQDLFINIDHIYDLQHNTGTIFSKIKSYMIDDGYSWLLKALDEKANIKNPHELINKISPSFKKLAIRAIYKKTGMSYEDFIKNNGDEKESLDYSDKILIQMDGMNISHKIARFCMRMKENPTEFVEYLFEHPDRYPQTMQLIKNSIDYENTNNYLRRIIDSVMIYTKIDQGQLQQITKIYNSGKLSATNLDMIISRLILEPENKEKTISLLIHEDKLDVIKFLKDKTGWPFEILEKVVSLCYLIQNIDAKELYTNNINAIEKIDSVSLDLTAARTYLYLNPNTSKLNKNLIRFLSVSFNIDQDTIKNRIFKEMQWRQSILNPSPQNQRISNEILQSIMLPPELYQKSKKSTFFKIVKERLGCSNEIVKALWNNSVVSNN